TWTQCVRGRNGYATVSYGDGGVTYGNATVGSQVRHSATEGRAFVVGGDQRCLDSNGGGEENGGGEGGGNGGAGGPSAGTVRDRLSPLAVRRRSSFPEPPC